MLKKAHNLFLKWYEPHVSLPGDYFIFKLGMLLKEADRLDKQLWDLLDNPLIPVAVLGDVLTTFRHHSVSLNDECEAETSQWQISEHVHYR